MSGAAEERKRTFPDRFWSDHIDFAQLPPFLKRLFPTKTAIAVAAETGEPVTSVKRWLAGEAVPGGRALLILFCCFGPELMVALMPGKAPDWLDQVRRGAKQKTLEDEIDERIAALRALRS